MTRAHFDPDSLPRTTQLELFPPARDCADASETVQRETARALVSPGWWPFVAPLFDPADNIEVRVCEERDGELILEAAGTTSAATPLEPIIARIREIAGRTCGCCGAQAGRPVRIAFAGPTRLACAACEVRLRNGEDYLAVADDFWRLDGTRRQPVARILPVPAVNRPTDGSGKRPITTLAPDELRALIREIRGRLSADIVGHPDTIARLSLLAALHVGGGLPRGGRALLIGPSGAGKSALVTSLRDAMSPWGLPVVVARAGDLSSPGWAGATIPALIEEAIKGHEPATAARGIVVLDELHHVGLVSGTHGNTDVARRDLLASFLGLAGYGTPIQLPETKREWNSDRALVIGVGAFTGLLDATRPIMIRDIVKAGIPLEVTTRLAQELIVMRRLGEQDLISLLHRWPELASLTEVCARLGYSVRIADEAYSRAARVVTLGHDASTARTAGAWLVSALRRALIDALDAPEPGELVITPDSLPIPTTATRPSPHEEPPSGPDDADAPFV